MLIYSLKRLLVAIPTLLALIAISFILMHSAPGSPFLTERGLPPEVIANLNAQYGLDKPMIVQLFNYVKDIVLHFDFGPSFIQRDLSVNEILAAGFPVTLTYGLVSFVFAVTVGAALGLVAAIRQNSWVDYFAVGFSIGSQSLPNFVMGPLLVLIFTLGLHWLPGGGWSFDDPSFWVMPVIALSTSYLASIARLTRSSMLEVLNTNPIRTARAKGLPERYIIMRHALKPALLPLVSYLGPAFVGMITGSVVIDTIFSTGGMGKFLVNAAFNRDYAVMLGVTNIIGALTIFFNLVVDILYAWIDPKIRY